MYYYIIDTPQSAQTARIAQRLQELVTPMGISGEITIATPARTSEELAYMGIDKGYTTIIAVGGEDLANSVATILMNESREKIAFGIIPLDAGSLIPQLIGVSNNDLRAGTEVIKKRHLDLVDLIQIGTKHYTFTEAVIAAPRRLKVSLEIDQSYKADLDTDWLHISRNLVVTVPANEQQNFIKRTFLSFGKRESGQTSESSQFHGQQIRVTAHEPLPIMIAGQIVAKTPTTFTRLPAALKLITTRAILPSKTMSDLPLRLSHQPREVSSQDA